MKKSFILTLIASLSITLACEKDTTDGDASCQYRIENYSVISDPSFSESGIIPMHLNNCWRYADSTWDENGNLTESGEFIIQPTEVGTYGDQVWWKTNFYPIQILRLGNDTIFDLKAGLAPCSFEAKNYFLFDEDSVSTGGVIWGDVGVVIDAYKVSSVTTPAGTFTDCFFYRKYGYNTTMIKPNIGIIEWSVGFENGNLDGRKLTLIEYYLE